MKNLLMGLLLCSNALKAQPLESQMGAIAAEAGGKVAVACALPGTKLRCNLLARSRPPMQSVFKLPLAIAVLHLVESGKFTLDEPIRFLKSDRILPKTYSLLQDKYPEADVDVPLRELAQSAVALSDNTASDVLLRIVGGPAVVDGYIASLGGARVPSGGRRGGSAPGSAGRVSKLVRAGGGGKVATGAERQVTVEPGAHGVAFALDAGVAHGCESAKRLSCPRGRR